MSLSLPCSLFFYVFPHASSSPPLSVSTLGTFRFKVNSEVFFFFLGHQMRNMFSLIMLCGLC